MRLTKPPYTAVVMPGYLLDLGVSYGLNGDPVGPMQPVERFREAVLGTKRVDSRLTELLRDTPSRIPCLGPSCGFLRATQRLRLVPSRTLPGREQSRVFLDESF
jgi:hypothetical protein